MKGRRERDEEESEVENRVTYYSPWDVTETSSGLLVPSYVLTQLLPHQRECLEWLHKLHERGWVRELHKWTPWIRVVLLHASGTGVNTSSSSACYEQLIEETFCYENDVSGGEEGEEMGYRERGEHAPTGGGVVISTYENVRQYQSLFLTREWDYVVLDEGHRVRNPDAETTLACKQLRTIHRIILSGTPIQNRLRELWSLFDFVYPGRSGTLPTFDDEFVLPIRAGGYATATKMQVLMAYKCALSLRDLIQSFLLRRTKQEILTNGADNGMGALLPGKQEQIIFCRLTVRQRALYRRFLSSSEVAKVLRRDNRPFRAISVLRHICNHPDLLASFSDGRLADKQRQSFEDDDEEEVASIAGSLNEMDEGKEEDGSDEAFGAASASGKMVVLQKVLLLWKAQGHRVLIFSQNARNPFAFLLTTRAGGIGVNLVGADRVVVFNPDWNPSTDVQARERAWRIGQQKPVTVFRLITAGTIEEKIYHRQIFKQYLTSKVLHDAKRKRCFNKHSLRELFVLGDEEEEKDGVAETNEMFVAGNVVRPAEAIDDYRDDGQSRDDKVDTEAGDNDIVLKQLFDGGDVRGVFDHSSVESDGVQNQEADLVEMEATKIAQRVLSALRASNALVRQQRETVYTPTWTGRSGAAGDPSQRRQQPSIVSRDAMASRLRRRPSRSKPIREHRVLVQSSGSSAPIGASEMAKRLHSFLAANAATGVTTERLLGTFGDVVGPKDKLVFRHVLRDMAVCRGRRWTLKAPDSSADSS
ncbi:unnamed protein product [Hyaloperonospora brassicae]|uniref:Helicase ATP-binding domain-containing protein n=1 Tax=Hyaloperonospora brassicae TaxID=162125 RepID=A0AAV0SYC5_HYABA|nr:unnamed protein product [Hyaloperonospora brassicae]